MIRVLIYLLIVAPSRSAPPGLPSARGEVAITWQGTRVETSVMVALVAVVAIAAAVTLLWSLTRALPALAGDASRASARRRRGARGYQAVSQG